jgi:spermidine/putrescine transport system ATP-binding protein
VLSDRVAVMNAGRIEQLAAPAALYERPRTRFVAQFLGSCNLIEATVAGVAASVLQANTPLGLFQVRLCGDEKAPAVGDHRTLAIRPEKLHLMKQGLAANSDPRLEVLCHSSHTANTVPATITELVYRGAETIYRLTCEGLSLSATTLNTRLGQQGLSVGQKVFCHLPAEALIVLDE